MWVILSSCSLTFAGHAIELAQIEKMNWNPDDHRQPVGRCATGEVLLKDGTTFQVYDDIFSGFPKKLLTGQITLKVHSLNTDIRLDVASIAVMRYPVFPQTERR